MGDVVPLVRWLTHREVMEHLGIGYEPLKRMMEDTPEDAERPWVNVGGLRRPTYRWDAAMVDSWAKEVGRWRDTVAAETATKSTGATPTASSDQSRSRASPRRARSNDKSSTRKTSGSGGSLATLFRSRLSEG